MYPFVNPFLYTDDIYKGDDAVVKLRNSFPNDWVSSNKNGLAELTSMSFLGYGGGGLKVYGVSAPWPVSGISLGTHSTSPRLNTNPRA